MSNFRITQAEPNLVIRSLLGVRPDIDKLGFERGHRIPTVLRKGGKIVTIPLAPRTARAIGERARRADFPAGGRPATASATESAI